MLSFCNLTDMGQLLNHTDIYREFLQRLSELDIPRDTPLRDYTLLRAGAVEAYLNGNLDSATALLLRSFDAIDSKVDSAAIAAQTLNLTATLYLKRNMPDSALYCVNRLLRAPVGPDIKVNSYKLLREIYAQKGDSVSSRQIYARMLMTRDSILNLYHLNSINNLKFINDLAAERHLAAEQLADTERKHKALDTTLLIVAILLVAMIPVLVVVVRRHRRLRKRYLELYRRTQLVLHAEEENRRRRETEMRALMLP